MHRGFWKEENIIWSISSSSCNFLNINNIYATHVNGCHLLCYFLNMTLLTLIGVINIYVFHSNSLVLLKHICSPKGIGFIEIQTTSENRKEANDFVLCTTRLLCENTPQSHCIKSR